MRRPGRRAGGTAGAPRGEVARFPAGRVGAAAAPPGCRSPGRRRREDVVRVRAPSRRPGAERRSCPRVSPGVRARGEGASLRTRFGGRCPPPQLPPILETRRSAPAPRSLRVPEGWLGGRLGCSGLSRRRLQGGWGVGSAVPPRFPVSGQMSLKECRQSCAFCRGRAEGTERWRRQRGTPRWEPGSCLSSRRHP